MAGRKSNAQRAMELANTLRNELKYDPLAELVRIAKRTKTKDEVKKQIAVELMQYIYPKQKAVELDQNNGQPVVFNIDLTGNATTPNIYEDEDGSAVAS